MNQRTQTESLTQFQLEIIDKTVKLVEEKLGGDSSGHDHFHILRVRNLAVRLAKEEGADAYVVELAALLHDIADWKFHDGDLTAGPRVASEWLKSLGESDETITKVASIISEVSYKGAGTKTTPTSLEGKVVQDADRLDAIGAIGIARTFAYGGRFERVMYDPNEPPQMHKDFEAYKNSKGTTLNHFYEKILLLQDRLNTDSGRKLAAERHKYTEEFVERFLMEWEGSR